MSLVEEVIDLRWRGYSRAAIRKALNLDHEELRSLLYQAQLVRQVTGLAGRSLSAPSSELLSAIEDLPHDRCRYIELDVEDPDARPCGRPISTVHLVRGRRHVERRSSWCAEHHAVVYSEVSENVRRFIV